MQVALHHVVLVRNEIVQIAGEENAFALAGSFWLDDECLAAGLAFSVDLELLAEVSKLSRQEPSGGDKLVLLGVLLEHFVQVAGEVVLTCQRVHPWEVVDPLVRLHFVETVYGHSVVRPQHIPLLLLSGCVRPQRLEIRQTHVLHRLTNVSNNVVLGFAAVQNQLLRLVLESLFLELSLDLGLTCLDLLLQLSGLLIELLLVVFIISDRSVVDLLMGLVFSLVPACLRLGVRSRPHLYTNQTW